MVCEAFDAEGRSKLVMGRTSLQRYPLPLRKLLPVCRSAVSSTVAGCADATKRGEGVVADSLIIDVNQPRGNPLDQGQTAIERARNDAQRESVFIRGFLS
jgi:hypothetical protein